MPKVNKIKNKPTKRRTIQRMSKTKSWFFEEIKELTNPHPMRYKAEEKNVQTNRETNKT